MSLHATLDITTAGDAVEFVFAVENPGTDSIDVSFRSGQTFDIVVYQADDEVWRWSDGRLFTQALQAETLAPGKSLVYETVWEHPSPGRYEAVATLLATTADVEAHTEFEV